MRDFKQLNFWRKSIDLAKDIYELTKNFPQEEKFGITSQIRRSVVSISANISEGCGRETQKDFKNFLNIAMGSSKETENLLHLSKELGYISLTDYNALNIKITEVSKMLNVFIKQIRESEINATN